MCSRLRNFLVATAGAAIVCLMPAVAGPLPVPGIGTMRVPGEEWTHVRGRWWFHRDHDD